MTLPAAVLRAATMDDVEAVAEVWHRAWVDGHLGHVPEALLPHRTLDHFRRRVPERIPSTTVAVIDARVVGFVTVREDEVNQLFVAEAARGTGVAAALLRHAEGVIALRADVAWLAVADGNARARRFYERQGWRDVAAIDYQADIEGGTIPVPCRRYERVLRG
jgi:GNAT superfamily N-acetyltransferase